MKSWKNDKNSNNTNFNDLTNTGREIVRHDLKLLLEDLESFEVKE